MIDRSGLVAYVNMAGKEEALASISALLLDEITTYSMTGWLSRSGSDDFGTLTLLRRDGRFLLRFSDKQRQLAEIVLNNVISYVIKVRSLTTGDGVVIHVSGN